MKAAFLLHLFLPLLLAGSSALRAQGGWFELLPPGPPPPTRVEVDAATLVDRGWGPELRLRVTHAEPRLHRDGLLFSSAVATVRFDCGAEAMEPIAVSYFAGPRGERALLATESDLGAAGVSPGLLAPVDPAVRSALLRGACGPPGSTGAGAPVPGEGR